MQYTDSENQAWKNVAPFFEPNGILDIDACEKYYNVHLSRPMHACQIEEDKGELLFALMKKTVNMPQAAQTFWRIYTATRRESGRLQPFLAQMAEHVPDTLRTWLKQTALSTNITEQILLLRDVKVFLPNDDVSHYTNPGILKMKPVAFVKKFNPNVSDMEYLLLVAQEFQTKLDYAHLGLLMVQGIFIAAYGKEHEPLEPSEKRSIAASLETKYSARNAFGMMQRANVHISPRDLMELIKVRYRAQCLESDALAYVYDSLDPAASPEQRAYGMQVLDTVLEGHAKNPSGLHSTGLLHVYSSLNNDSENDNNSTMRRIESALLHHIASDQTPSRSIPAALQLAPNLIPQWMDTIQTRANDDQNQQLLHALYMGGHNQNLLYQNMGSPHFQHPEKIRQLSQGRTKPEQITQLFSSRFEAIMSQTNSNGTAVNSLYKISSLQDAMRAFVRHEWPQEKLEHLKKSTIVPKWVLTTLCMGASCKIIPGQQISVMPQLDQEPLPLLRTLYPEHMLLWNTMLKSMLSHEAEDLENYNKKQTLLFNIFAGAFLPGKPTLEHITVIAAAMGMEPLDYVLTACEHAHTMILPYLDGNIFDLDV